MSRIGFKVVRKENLKKWEIEREFKTMVESDHKKFDCFVCIMSSHGTANKIYGTDGYEVVLAPQIQRFRTDSCPSLDGKPKIFLFQACNSENDGKYGCKIIISALFICIYTLDIPKVVK